MADQPMPTARSPLEGVTGQVGGRHDAGVALAELRFQGKLNLRGNADDPGFALAVAGVVGTAPPATPGTVAETDGRSILWLGPDEWLVVTPPAEAAAMAAGLDAALAGIRRAGVVDVSDNYTTLRISGPRAPWVLAKGWAVDLHSDAFATGRVAQSNLALANVILRRTDDAPSYEILVRPSFARYLWDWLTDAALEVGYRVEAG